MIVAVLTGSLAMGKSTVAKMFEAEGVPVFDADLTVHRLQGVGGSLVEPIEAAFPGTTSAEGVDRLKLGNIVFGNPSKMALLESIVHPAVAQEREIFLRNQGGAPLVILDIPLFFEGKTGRDVDAVIVVSAPLVVQRERALARPNMSPEKFERIVAMQVPDADKLERADFVIDTGASIEATRQAVRDVITCLASSKGR